MLPVQETNTRCHLWSTDTSAFRRVRCPTCVRVSVRHRHDTRTTFYILDITGIHVSVSVSCPVSVSVLVLHRMSPPPSLTRYKASPCLPFDSKATASKTTFSGFLVIPKACWREWLPVKTSFPARSKTHSLAKSISWIHHPNTTAPITSHQINFMYI